MMKFKRMVVFLIDFFIAMLMAGFINIAANIKTSQSFLLSLERSWQDFQFGDTTWIHTFNKIANIIQLNDKNSILSLLIMGISIIVIWIIIPFLFNEQTLGMKLLKIKLEMSEKYDLKAITMRALLLSGLGMLIISLLLLYIVNGPIYFILVLILIIIQIILIIWDVFMVLYSSNGHNIVDKWSHTKMVEVKK